MCRGKYIPQRKGMFFFSLDHILNQKFSDKTVGQCLWDLRGMTIRLEAWRDRSAFSCRRQRGEGLGPRECEEGGKELSCCALHRYCNLCS